MLLWIAYAAHRFAQLPSEFIRRPSRDIAFDLACSLRLMQWEREQKEDDFKALRYNVYRGALSTQIDHPLFDETENKSDVIEIPEGVEAW